MDLTTEESYSDDGKNGAASNKKFDDLVDQYEKWAAAPTTIFPQPRTING